MDSVRPSSILWTKEEDAILYKFYPEKGTDIPELLAQRSARAIRVRASKLGINCKEEVVKARKSVGGSNKCIPVVCDGVEYKSLTEACATLGLNYDSIISIQCKKKVSVQEALDIYVANKNKVAQRWDCLPMTIYGVECQTLQDVADCLGVKIATIRGKMTREGCTPREAIEYYVTKGAPMRVTKSDGAEAISYAYMTEDGVPYYFVLCQVCHKVLLLSRTVVRSFTHGTFCDSNEVPRGVIMNHGIFDVMKREGYPCPYRSERYT